MTAHEFGLARKWVEMSPYCACGDPACIRFHDYAPALARVRAERAEALRRFIQATNTPAEDS